MSIWNNIHTLRTAVLKVISMGFDTTVLADDHLPEDLLLVLCLVLLTVLVILERQTP
jgi:hypothetical protein